MELKEISPQSLRAGVFCSSIDLTEIMDTRYQGVASRFVRVLLELVMEGRKSDLTDCRLWNYLFCDCFSFENEGISLLKSEEI